MNEPPNKDWHYHPDLPLKDISVFNQWRNPHAVAKWFYNNWLTLSEFVLLALLATVLWLWCYPSLDRAIEFKADWILQNLLVNFVLVLVVAGSLHWFFYMRRAQKKRLKFDGRDQTRNNRAFLFSDQVKDNMFWSLSRVLVPFHAKSDVKEPLYYQYLTMLQNVN